MSFVSNYIYIYIDISADTLPKYISVTYRSDVCSDELIQTLRNASLKGTAEYFNVKPVSLYRKAHTEIGCFRLVYLKIPMNNKSLKPRFNLNAPH